MRESHDLSEALQLKIERLPEVERAFVHIDYECGYYVKTEASSAVPEEAALDEDVYSVPLHDNL